MLLVIDIGNTNITVGCYAGDDLLFTGRISTDERKTGDQYAIDLYNIFRLNKVSHDKFENCILCSVVPSLDHAFRYAVKKVTGKKPMAVGPGIKTGLNIKIDDPAQLGADLVVGAVAAISKYPAPIVILDLGTATTISVVDENGRFLGGSICAGLGITLDALSSRTSMLPRISIEAPKNPIGTNTVDSMKSGLVLGSAAMIDGMITRIERQIGKVKSVVATGGLCPVVIENCDRDITFNDNLLLEGLKIIYQKNI